MIPSDVSALPAAASAGRATPASKFATVVPKVVYQTMRDGNTQNGAAPLVLDIQLSRAAASAIAAAMRAKASLQNLIHGALRRFDLTELELFDAPSNTMLGLRLSQAIFSYELRDRDSVLRVFIHRKELPVSTNYGDAPFVFVFRVKPGDEVVVSSVFHVASKEPEDKPPRPEPKRKRAPSAKLPFFALATGDEAAINAMLNGKVSVAAVGPVAVAVSAPVTPVLPISADVDAFAVLFAEDVAEKPLKKAKTVQAVATIAASPDAPASPAHSCGSGGSGDSVTTDWLDRILAGGDEELAELPMADLDEAMLMESLLAFEQDVEV